MLRQSFILQIFGCTCPLAVNNVALLPWILSNTQFILCFNLFCLWLHRLFQVAHWITTVFLIIFQLHMSQNLTLSKLFSLRCIYQICKFEVTMWQVFQIISYLISGIHILVVNKLISEVLVFLMLLWLNSIFMLVIVIQVIKVLLCCFHPNFSRAMSY